MERERDRSREKEKEKERGLRKNKKEKRKTKRKGHGREAKAEKARLSSLKESQELVAKAENTVKVNKMEKEDYKQVQKK